MSLAPADLFTSFMIGLVGLALIMWGRRQSRIPQLAAGVLLVVVSTVVPGWLLQLVAALALIALLWFLVRLGA